MIIPAEAIPYIQLQVGGIDEESLPIDEAYARHCQQIADNIQDLFYVNPLLLGYHIVDIGGGLAGASMLLAKDSGATLHIVDGDEADGIPERRCEDKSFNSFAVTKAFHHANGFERTVFHHLSLDHLPETIQMVVSFASWGFHFPLNRYMSIIGKMPPGAPMVIDLRSQKNKIEKLAPYFYMPQLETINWKRIRCYMIRNEVPYEATV